MKQEAGKLLNVVAMLVSVTLCLALGCVNTSATQQRGVPLP